MSDHPEFVYRIASADEWRLALDTGMVPKRDIDERDGYMHLSTRTQLLETANLHFAGAQDLLALEMPLAPIVGQTKFELAPKRGEAFPHLYADLTRAMVVRAIHLVAGATGFEFGDDV